MHQLKIPNIWRRGLIVAIPKPEIPLGDPKNHPPISSLCVPFKILGRLIHARVEPIIDPLLFGSRRAFDTGGRPLTNSPCWHKTLRIALQLKRRSELCSSNSQQPMTLYGTVGSPASCCNWYLIDTWLTWSRKWLAIAALPFPPETAKEAGYDASRTPSHRDRSWRSFSSTSTSLTCQPPSPESMHMLTI